MKEKRYIELMLWAVVFIWGTNYTVGKWAMPSFEPLSFTVLRFVGVTPILFIVLYLLEKNIRISLRDVPELAFLGLVGISIYQTMFMATIKYASATNASLLIAVSPVFTALFAWLSKQEHLGSLGRLGTVMAFIGVILVVVFGTNKLETGTDALKGDLIGILASNLWGAYPVLSRRMLNKYSALKTITYASLFGTFFLVLIGLPSLSRLVWSNITPIAWASLLYGLGPVTGYGLVAWYHGISKVGANRVMSHQYAVPVIAVITARILLGESLHALQVAGALVIFTGIYLIRRDKNSLANKTQSQSQAA